MAKNTDPTVVLSLEKINELENIIDSSPAPRFGGNTDRRIVDIDEIYNLLGDLKVTIPEDVRKADSIINNAKNITSKAEEFARELEDLSAMDDCYFFGSDIDSQAVASAKRNAQTAGVSDFIRFRVADAETLPPESLRNITKMDRQLIVTNPPYGGRLMTPEEADDIYRMIGRTYLKDGKCKKGIRLSVISPDDTFERAIGHKADKRVKLYNGNIKCQLNNFYKLAK